MVEEKKETWLTYLAITTVVIAVFATLSTFMGNKNSTRSVIAQTQAANQWSYYQSKSIKGYLYELEMEKLQLESMGEINNKERAAYNMKIAEYSSKIEKYEEEKRQIKLEAEKCEKFKEDAQKHSQSFGIGVIYLQIAILLCSVSAVMKNKYFWVIGGCSGAIGIIYFANGYATWF